MTRNSKQTSARVGSLASRTLLDPNASKLAKRLAGSALAQRADGKQTGADMEEVAARALADERTADTTQRLAASVTSQSNRQR